MSMAFLCASCGVTSVLRGPCWLCGGPTAERAMDAIQSPEHEEANCWAQPPGSGWALFCPSIGTSPLGLCPDHYSALAVR